MRYYVDFQHNGTSFSQYFDTPLARSLFIISVQALGGDVLRTYEQSWQKQ